MSEYFKLTEARIELEVVRLLILKSTIILNIKKILKNAETKQVPTLVS